MPKRWFGTAILAAFMSTPALAAQVAVDDFSTYTVGELIGQTGSAEGFAGPWTGGPQGTFTITSGNQLQAEPPQGFFAGIEALHDFESSSNGWIPNDGDSLYLSYRLH